MSASSTARGAATLAQEAADDLRSRGETWAADRAQRDADECNTTADELQAERRIPPHEDEA